ncbi:MAG TPA: C25 family cysteine peptidase, partial [Chitinivibrionales bacterium]
NKADYLVITHPDFMDQARKLATHKNTIGRFQYAKAVDVNDIYREFSGGNLDPAAIRNFLLYANNLWSVKPQFVVLMGKGHYDYKSIVSSEPIFIPIYEWQGRCTDDFFCYLDPGARVDSNSPPVCVPDMFLGRLPCITADQAAQMVSKIIAMEDPAAADLGAWRDRALLVNDDDMQGSAADPLGTEHLDASKSVGDAILNLRPSVDMRKINMFEYPWNAVWEKPEARNALIGAFNGGAALVNFFGHGNPQQWADENILNVQLVANLNNIKQYPLVSSFSCSVGKFDQPGKLSLSEALVLAPQSGAIATFASMRQAYSENNKQLALAFYNCLFDSTRASVTFGEACTQAKITVGDQNSQIYSYLGDPSISPVLASHRISLNLIDVSGSSKDTLKALQTVTVRGSVLMGDGITVDSRYGTAEKPAFVQVSVFNPPQSAKRKDNGTLHDPTDTLPGTPIFTGQIKVQNGIFNQLLHIPRNVTFNKPGAKAIAFSWNAFDNGLGCKEFIFKGTEADSSRGIDTVGPRIAIKALSDDPAALVALNQDKIQANLPFKCEITVTDSGGIDATGTGPDEGLTMEIPGCIAKQNINNKFSFLGGDFRKGSATVDFGEGVLKSGTYTLVISAQDLSGNVTRHNFSMEISQAQDLAISRIFNFPNPMKMGTTTAFYYNLSKTSNVRSTLKVYAMSGKLLRVFYNAHSGEVFDGRDQMGNILGPKVYLYQVTAEDLDQQKTVKSGIQKLVVHPPR